MDQILTLHDKLIVHCYLYDILFNISMILGVYALKNWEVFEKKIEFLCECIRDLWGMTRFWFVNSVFFSFHEVKQNAFSHNLKKIES